MIQKYQQVAEQIRNDCLRRNMPPDSFLPTELELADTFKVNRLTVRRALKQLEQQQVVSPIVGKRRRLLAVADHSSKTALIGCLGHSSSSPDGTFGNLVFARVFDQMAKVFQSHNLNLLGIPVDSSVTQPPKVVRSPLMKALLVFETLPENFSLGTVHLPLIAMHAPIDSGLTADYKIDFDYFGLAAKAVAKLAASGHRRIVWVEWTKRTVNGFAVEHAGYESAMKRYNCSAPLFLGIDDFPAPDIINVQSQIKKLLRNHPDVDAFITASSDLNPFLMAGLTAAGVSVPDKVSVLGLAGQEPAVGRLQVTGYYNDYPAIAEAICEFIRLIITSQIKHIDRITLSQTRWEEGETMRVRN